MSEILTSLHGKLIGLDKDGRLIVKGGLALGENHKQLFTPDSLRQAMFNDFDGAVRAYSTTVADGILSRKGSDGACVDWTVTRRPAARWSARAATRRRRWRSRACTCRAACTSSRTRAI
jgi:hypothetical protein